MTPLSERDFQRQVTELAELYGWEWMHPRAGRTVDSWRTPMSGTMAQGWPDLVLINEKQRRLLFVELKADKGLLTAHQERVLEVLESVQSSPLYRDYTHREPIRTSIEVAVWRPVNWPLIQETLSERRAA